MRALCCGEAETEEAPGGCGVVLYEFSTDLALFCFVISKSSPRLYVIVKKIYHGKLDKSPIVFSDHGRVP